MHNYAYMVTAQPRPQLQEQGHRALLSAIAAFFDRFAGSGLMGTLCFSMGPAARLGFSDDSCQQKGNEDNVYEDSWAQET